MTQRRRVERADVVGGHARCEVLDRVVHTRTVETQHPAGQLVGGTVVSEEHPGAPVRHDPDPTLDGRYERRNVELQEQTRARLGGVPTFLCGRLATYTYIDQDQAIERALECAEEVERQLR